MIEGPKRDLGCIVESIDLVASLVEKDDCVPKLSLKLAILHVAGGTGLTYRYRNSPGTPLTLEVSGCDYDLSV